MGTIIGYETTGENGRQLKMLCKNEDCGVESYAGEPVSTNSDGVEPTLRAFFNPLFAHFCIMCKTTNVEPVPIYEESEEDYQERQYVMDQTLREHEERQLDYESMLPRGTCGITSNEDGEWWY